MCLKIVYSDLSCKTILNNFPEQITGYKVVHEIEGKYFPLVEKESNVIFVPGENIDYNKNKIYISEEKFYNSGFHIYADLYESCVIARFWRDIVTHPIDAKIIVTNIFKKDIIHIGERDQALVFIVKSFIWKEIYPEKDY